jgi:hypothetical protein
MERGVYYTRVVHDMNNEFTEDKHVVLSNLLGIVEALIYTRKTHSICLIWDGELTEAMSTNKIVASLKGQENVEELIYDCSIICQQKRRHIPLG